MANGKNTLSSRVCFWLVFAGAACLLAANLAAVPLLDPDEARFARTSVEMMRGRDLVVPHFEDQPRLVKPPLVHWIQTSSFRLFGVGPGPARLHAALATLGSLLLCGWIARSRFGGEAAAWSVAVLGTMPLVIAAGHLGTIDALLALHVFAAVALDLGGARDRPFAPYALGAITGLAFLAKGPVGVIVPLLVILAGRTATRREILPSTGAAGRAVAAWCVVVLPWGMAFVQRVAFGRTWETLRTEVLERYLSGVDHAEPPWFFIQIVAVGMLPWAGPLGVGLVRAARERHDPATRTALYAGAGFVAGVAFFSLGRSKLPTYILPLAPLAALVVTWQLGRELEQPALRPWGSWLLAVTMLLLALGLGVGAGSLDTEIRAVAWAGTVAYGVAAIFAGAVLVKRQALAPRWVHGTAAAATALFAAAAILFLLPTLAVQRTSAYLVREVPELSGATPVAVVDMKVPSLTFYLDKVPEQIDMAHLASRLEQGGPLLLVFDEGDLGAVPPGALGALTEVGRHGKYVVFRL